MSKSKSIFALSEVIRRAKDKKSVRLPGATTRLPLELMHKQRFNGDFIGDLRVSARDSGAGFRGR